jgi:hypothetical protein
MTYRLAYNDQSPIPLHASVEIPDDQAMAMRECLGTVQDFTKRLLTEAGVEYVEPLFVTLTLSTPYDQSRMSKLEAYSKNLERIQGMGKS